VRGCFLAILALIQGDCASRDLRPLERVDPDTAVHVTIVAVVEANRTGTQSYWLNVVSWSTSARGEEDAGDAKHGPVSVLLDSPAKQAQLACTADGRSAAGVSEPVISVRWARLGEAWCALSAAQVAEFGGGAPTAISLVDAGGSVQSYLS